MEGDVDTLNERPWVMVRVRFTWRQKRRFMTECGGARLKLRIEKEFEARKLLNFQFETNQILNKQSTNVLLNFHFQNKLLAPLSQTLHIPA
jgi:hypothetical protein